MATAPRSIRSSSSHRCSLLGRLAGVAAVAGAVLCATSSAHAAGLNDPSCKPTAARPYPVVMVHGHGGNYEGMSAISNTLVQDGYCVYGRNYGKIPNGFNGHDHLSNSAGQISAFIDEVLSQTKATKVNVVGHSAGVGVLNNYMQKKGGAAKVHRAAMFGGLHHPYAHVGVANVGDATLYLPNMVAAARRVVPGISAQLVVRVALNMYASAGSPLGMIDPVLAATMQSNFTNDLFDPDYWQDLQGGQSEAPLSFIRFGQSQRGKTTNDSVPNVCYTNIVAVTDLVTGATAGFQDEAPNVDNFLVHTLSVNAHNDMLADPVALDRMVSAFNAPCTPGPAKNLAGESVGDVGSEADDAVGAFESAVVDEHMSATGERRSSPIVFNSGCSTTREAPAGAGGFFAAGLALMMTWVRRRAARNAAKSSS